MTRSPVDTDVTALPRPLRLFAPRRYRRWPGALHRTPPPPLADPRPARAREDSTFVRDVLWCVALGTLYAALLLAVL